MSLDGLRAWIGEVERKLGMRTRVFLVLSAIAIAGAAAGIYLALDAANESVSKDEVRALQEQAGAVEPGEAAAVSALKAELEALRSEVSELKGKGASSGAEGKGTPPAAESGGTSESEGEATPPSSKQKGASSDAEQKGTSSSPEQAPPAEAQADPSEKLRKEPR